MLVGRLIGPLISRLFRKPILATRIQPLKMSRCLGYSFQRPSHRSLLARGRDKVLRHCDLMFLFWAHLPQRFRHSRAVGSIRPSDWWPGIRALEFLLRKQATHIPFPERLSHYISPNVERVLVNFQLLEPRRPASPVMFDGSHLQSITRFCIISGTPCSESVVRCCSKCNLQFRTIIMTFAIPTCTGPNVSAVNSFHPDHVIPFMFAYHVHGFDTLSSRVSALARSFRCR